MSKKIRFPSLRQRISFLYYGVVVDTIGNHTNDWSEECSMWARVTDTNYKNSSSETTEAGVTKERQALTFYVRDCTFTRSLATNKYRISFKGSIYNIVGIIPDYDRNGYVNITAERCERR